MSTEINSKEPCPLCLKNGVVNYLTDRPGQFFTSCRAGHKFEDTTELRMLQAEARKNYPNFYRQPEKPQPTDFSNANIVIDPESKKLIEEQIGSVLTSAADLKGHIFAYIQDNKDMESEIRRLKASMATMRSRPRVTAGGAATSELAPGQVVLTLPEWALEGGIAEQAEHAGMTVDEWVSQEIGAYFENYFSQAARRQ